MKDLTKITAREAITQFRQKYKFPELHQIYTSAILPTEARDWGIEEMSERMILPMVCQLFREIPPDGVVCPYPLEVPKSCEAASEVFDGVSMRTVAVYYIQTDATLLRLDLRFWSLLYTKQRKAREFRRKVESIVYFWRRFVVFEGGEEDV